jgi:hypothetical protein
MSDRPETTLQRPVLPAENGLHDERFVSDDRATSIYQAIFGKDVVTRAYIGKPEEIAPELLRSPEPDEDGSLPTAGDVIIELRNGRLVRLWTSEWGGAWSYLPGKT